MMGWVDWVCEQWERPSWGRRMFEMSPNGRGQQVQRPSDVSELNMPEKMQEDQGGWRVLRKRTSILWIFFFSHLNSATVCFPSQTLVLLNSKTWFWRANPEVSSSRELGEVHLGNIAPCVSSTCAYFHPIKSDQNEQKARWNPGTFMHFQGPTAQSKPWVSFFL